MKKIFAFLMMAATLAACMQMEQPSPIDKPETPQEQEETLQTYTLTVAASKAPSPKALSLGGENNKTLYATWAEGEIVTVYNVTKHADLGGYLEAQSSGASTTLKGELTGTIEPADKLILKFLSPNYSGQDGTLEYIATHCDYAEAEVDVTDASTASITTTDASFQNRQAIIKFTLKDKDNNDAAISPSAFTVTDGTNTVTLTNISAATYTANEAANVLYVAFPAASSAKTISLSATVGSSVFTYSRSDVTFANGQYYAISVKMTKSVPLFSIGNNEQVYFSPGNLQATYNGSAWTWAFAEHQWDYIGNAAGNTCISGNGTVSANNVTVELFGWSTAATTLGIHNSQDYSPYFGVFVDWGSNTNVQTGIGTGWRTLSRGEWLYLFTLRPVSMRYTLGQTVNGVLGIVIYPDNYTGPEYATGSNWATFEAAGCVFLPAAGYRVGTSVIDAGTAGYYWAETSDDDSSAHNMLFNSDDLFINSIAWSRYAGLSVRLVRDAN